MARVVVVALTKVTRLALEAAYTKAVEGVMEEIHLLRQ
jgi:hypothetical protein